jgi:hypothetical protein
VTSKQRREGGRERASERARGRGEGGREQEEGGKEGDSERVIEEVERGSKRRVGAVAVTAATATAKQTVEGGWWLYRCRRE